MIYSFSTFKSKRMKLQKHAGILLTLFFIVQLLNGQESRYSFEVFKNDKGDSLLYRSMLSDANSFDKLPLVIFLHGSGERGSDNVSQLKWGAMQFASDEFIKMFPCVVIAPQCPRGTGWGNYVRDGNGFKLADSPSKTMELLHELILKVKNSGFIDSNRIYITGLSMGGIGTFDALARYPELFAAAMPVCGAGDTAMASRFSKIPMWIIGGAEDGAVSPEESYKMADALRKEGARPGLTIYPDVGHFSWVQAYSDMLQIQWLFRQRKP